MKKRIIDLTLEEATKICNNGGKYFPCSECPLYLGEMVGFCWRTVIYLVSREKLIDLEQEVEVDVEQRNRN